MTLVKMYLQRAGGFEGIRGEDRSPSPRGFSDPVYLVTGRRSKRGIEAGVGFDRGAIVNPRVGGGGSGSGWRQLRSIRGPAKSGLRFATPDGEGRYPSPVDGITAMSVIRGLWCRRRRPTTGVAGSNPVRRATSRPYLKVRHFYCKLETQLFTQEA